MNQLMVRIRKIEYKSSSVGVTYHHLRCQSVFPRLSDLFCEVIQIRIIIVFIVFWIWINFNDFLLNSFVLRRSVVLVDHSCLEPIEFTGKFECNFRWFVPLKCCCNIYTRCDEILVFWLSEPYSYTYFIFMYEPCIRMFL
jgi:hypothetical protein